MHPAVTAHHLIKRQRARDVQAQQLAQEIQKQLPSWVEFLVQQGARRVILFGSLARGGFRVDSDVDLAVEGMPSDNYFHAVGELLRRCPCPCDLVTLERASPLLTQRIHEDGVVLYEGRSD